ncbi:MAG: hypothetical protein QM589_07905 [Thermomicrobiales bacterium]
MYELWDSLTNNLVDTYPTAIDAEHRIRALVSEYGQAALDRFFLSYEAEDEANDALIGEGVAMLAAVHHRADAERALLDARSVE